MARRLKRGNTGGGAMTFTVTGDRELDRALNQLGAKLAKKHLRKAMRKGLKPIAAEAKALAPVDEGKLKRNIKVRSGKRRRGFITLRVVVDGKDFEGDFFYPAVQEYGSQELGIQGVAYMRRAFERKGPEGRSTTLAELRKAVELEAALLGRRSSG